MSNATKQYTPADAGCLINGHMGHYATVRVLEIAEAAGMTISNVTRFLMDTYDTHYHAENYPFDWIVDEADEAVEWMNEHVAPEGHSFGWYDGEFFLWSDETWEEM